MRKMEWAVIVNLDAASALSYFFMISIAFVCGAHTVYETNFFRWFLGESSASYWAEMAAAAGCRLLHLCRDSMAQVTDTFTLQNPLLSTLVPTNLNGNSILVLKAFIFNMNVDVFVRQKSSIWTTVRPWRYWGEKFDMGDLNYSQQQRRSTIKSLMGENSELKPAPERQPKVEYLYYSHFAQ